MGVLLIWLAILVAVILIDYGYRKLMGLYGWGAVAGGILGFLFFTFRLGEWWWGSLEQEPLADWLMDGFLHPLLTIVLVSFIPVPIGILSGIVAGDVVWKVCVGTSWPNAGKVNQEGRERAGGVIRWFRLGIAIGLFLTAFALFLGLPKVIWRSLETESLTSRMDELIEKKKQLVKGGATPKEKVEPLLKEFNDLHRELQELKKQSDKQRVIGWRAKEVEFDGAV